MTRPFVRWKKCLLLKWTILTMILYSIKKKLTCASVSVISSCSPGSWSLFGHSHHFSPKIHSGYLKEFYESPCLFNHWLVKPGFKLFQAKISSPLIICYFMTHCDCFMSFVYLFIYWISYSFMSAWLILENKVTKKWEITSDIVYATENQLHNAALCSTSGNSDSKACQQQLAFLWMWRNRRMGWGKRKKL